MEVNRQVTPLTLLVLSVNSVFWTLLIVLVFNLPTNGMLWITGTLMCSVASLGQPTRAKRAAAKIRNILSFGALQFLYAVLEPSPWVLVLTAPLAVLLTSLGRRANEAGAVMTAGLMNYDRGRYQGALDILCLCILLAGIIAASGWLLDRWLFGKSEWRGNGDKPPMTKEMIVRRMIAFAVAFWLYGTLSWQMDYWIPLTVGFSYSNGASGMTAREFAFRRTVGSLGGFLLATVYLGTFCYLDARFNDLAPLWGIAGYYRKYRTGSVAGFGCFYVVMICCVDNLLHPGSPLYGNPWNLFFQMLVSGIIGALIVEAAEWRPDFRH